jgi:hypothetical protein
VTLSQAEALTKEVAVGLPIRGTKDFWTGLIYIFFGASAVIIGRDYPMGTAFRMGPAYFPTILGGLLVFIGLISLVRSLIVKDAPIGAFALKGLILVIASVMLFGFLAKSAGVVIALPLLVIVSAYASARFRWGATLALATGLTLFCILVFLRGLGVPLPIVGPWLGG